MARRKGFFAELAQQQRLIEKKQQAEQKLREKEAKRLQQAHVAHQRLVARTEKETEKERKRLYLEAREAKVEVLNAELEEKVANLNNILQATLSIDDHIDLETLKANPIYPSLSIPLQLVEKLPKPQLDDFLPQELSTFARFVPGRQAKYEKEKQKAQLEYENALRVYQELDRRKAAEILRLRESHEAELERIKAKVAEQHAEIEAFQERLKNGEPESIVDYCVLVLNSSVYPDDFPQKSKVAYVPESKQLVIEYDLPTFDVVPEVLLFKYTKTKDEITTTSRPMTQRKALYASIISQIALRTVHEIFEADRLGHIETVVFNGYVDSVDKATGRDIHTCLITLRTSKSIFETINLARVEPEVCLKNLSATVSKSPSELAPVRPVIEFNMVDSRFVEEADVISTLDTRPNLMELSPSEFESLITNLFQKMGLEAKQTQASRDGGVDCVAFDPRPIFGGKVVIQAKRYKNTVGVGAVRDLYGTLQNEGASKGILVTTSGYGKAAFEFAQGKPIELLSGSNLLYLLEQHASIQAKIEMPPDWRDGSLDVSE